MVRGDVNHPWFMQSSQLLIHPPWSRVADRLSLCQVLAEGALSARDGERLGSGLPDGAERRERRMSGEGGDREVSMLPWRFKVSGCGKAAGVCSGSVTTEVTQDIWIVWDYK